jgi:DUF3089 family protein
MNARNDVRPLAGWYYVRPVMPPAARLPKVVVAAALLAALVSGCGSGKKAATTTTSVAATTGARDQWGTAWLCRPGLVDNPCLTDRTATAVRASGAKRVEPAVPGGNPQVDCFYVYPTVSGQQTINANLQVGLRERLVATAQASRFSQVCRVYAPVYPQITLAALEHPARITRADALRAYDAVVAAFRNYVTHYNHGRGIVFIGHSQGAAILIRLLQQEVDPDRAARRRLVSALLLGGNVTVAKGRDVGGSFAHIPACASRRQTGCVVAYSAFTSRPPTKSDFGRTTSDAGVNLLAPASSDSAREILCVNPGSPSGGKSALDPYVPTLALAFGGSTLGVTTPWVAYSGGYAGRCESSGNAGWLQITHGTAGTDRRPDLTRLQQPVLGLHVLDVNIALGNLVSLVGDEAAAYR